MTRILQRLLDPLARRLELRIVALFLGLLLMVQLASFVAIRHSIDENARTQIATELRTGENVLRRLLSQNAQNLTEAARLLAQDFGFRSAIAGGDQLTLVDALENQAARIGASAALFTDARRRLVASTLSDPKPVLSLVQAEASGSAANLHDTPVRVLDGQPFQLVTVPVKAPQLIGHVSMGFPLSADLPRDMEDLSSLKMALIARAPGGPWKVLPIGARADELQSLATELHSASVSQNVSLAGENDSVRIVRLGGDATHEIAAALLRSIDQAVAPYRQLQLTLLVITLIGVVVFGIGSFVTARSITRPIKALSQSAERLGAGDYSTPMQVNSRDEVHELARSFESMRTGMQQREAQILRLAYWDSLTGLPNRAQFIDLLKARIERARSGGEPCSVLMLDLDRFKHVNDVLGHAFGDRLLCQIAQRLNDGVLREQDVVARLGGDEFAVCLPQADDETAGMIAQRMRRSLEQPVMLDDHAVDVSAGVGIATFPAHGGDAEVLLGRAEMAMYAAKSNQSGVMHYDSGLDSSSQESLSLLSELRQAVDHDQLRLYLQPKIALCSGLVLGAEALVRWQHPTRGLVPPMRFIPFAEQTGFIRVLTGWMIERCSARYRHLQGQGLELKFSINLSTRDLLDQDLPAKLEKMLTHGGVDPKALCLEITESAIMDDPQRALQTLQRLHGMGLRLSIDDFGTGYSSLAYLKRLPLHELKIDQSFVKAMEHDRADLKIVRSTIDLAHNLGLSVVAEGVENAQTWALLQALHCDEAQGYYMARPMPEDQFAGWVDGWASPHERLRTEFAELVV